MGKEKIVLDTNILISALGWKGKPREIFQRILEGDFELIISKEQLEELKEVMNYERLNFAEEQKDKFLTIILSIATIVEIPRKLNIIKEDPDDDLIIESAIESNSKYLIRGDEHLLKIKKFSNVKILTAKEFLNIINKI